MDSAPYVIALVHNSWMAIDKATALLGCTLDPMLQFAEQKVALLFCLLAISYVAKHDAQTVPQGEQPIG
jgi:hypothetical protein